VISDNKGWEMAAGTEAGCDLLGVKHVMDACRANEYSGAWPPCECTC